VLPRDALDGEGAEFRVFVAWLGVGASAGVDEMKAVVVSGAILVGLIFIGLAALYWLTPAGNLPAYVPGYEQGSTRVHVTHGVGMLIIGLIAFALTCRSWGD
jgi:hypothetical protein